MNRAVEALAGKIPKLLSAGAGLRLRARVVPDGGLLAEVSGDIKASPDPNDRG